MSTDIQRLVIQTQPKYLPADNSASIAIEVQAGSTLSRSNAQPAFANGAFVAEGTIPVASSSTFLVGQWVWCATGDAEVFVTTTPRTPGANNATYVPAGTTPTGIGLEIDVRSGSLDNFLYNGVAL